MPRFTSAPSTNASAGADEVPHLGHGDVAAISTGGFVLLCCMGCCVVWCLRRRLFPRAVSPNIIQPRHKGLAAGDIVDRAGDVVNRARSMLPPAAEAPAPAPTTQAAEDLEVTDTEPTPRFLLKTPPADQSRSQVLALADVSLLDDPYGGVWAQVRPTDGDAPLSPPQRRLGLNDEEPDDGSEGGCSARNEDEIAAVENDLVLETLVMGEDDRFE